MARYFLFFLGLSLFTACQDNNSSAEADQKPPVKEASLSETTATPDLPHAQAAIEDKASEVSEEDIVAKKEAQVKEKTPVSPPKQKEEVGLEKKAPAIQKVAKPAENPKNVEVKQASEKTTPKETLTPPPFSHDSWNALLQKHVSSTGRVNYKGFKSELSKLESYLESLSATPPQSSWSRNEKLAYWINAYNAFTVKLILDNYPTSSITKLKGGKPWDVKWIKIGTSTYSLNNIENDIIRPRFKDARIHFAVNCAALSCPPLLNQAFTPSQLSTQLNKQARKFVNNPKYNTITPDAIKVSKIFEWYSSDFGNSLIDYLNKYSETTINSGAKIQYLEYDWALNNR